MSVYSFYQYSAVKYKNLRKLKQTMNVHAKRFKRPTKARRLSLQDSIMAMLSALNYLVLALGQEASQSKSAYAAQAKGILKTVKTFKFISTICMLADLLEAICKCSKVFQKDTLGVAEMTDMGKFQCFGNGTSPKLKMTPNLSQYPDFLTAL